MANHEAGRMSLLTSRSLWLNLPFGLYPLILGGCHLDHLVKELYKEMDKTIFMSKRRWSYWEVAMGGVFLLWLGGVGVQVCEAVGYNRLCDTHMQSRNSYMFVQE